MVTIKTRSGSAYETLWKLFKNDFEPEKGYPMRIPLIGNHVTLDNTLIYWDWHSVHEKNNEEAVLEIAPNIIFVEVNGQRRGSIDTKHLKRLWISVQGGLFQKMIIQNLTFCILELKRKTFIESFSFFLSCP